MDIEQPVVNGTEGGGAGAYQTSQMRMCPQGGQQQDPKQQPQQTTVPVLVTGGMQHNMYPTSRQNAINQYYQPRGSSHNPRMSAAQARPMNLVYQNPHPQMNQIYLPQIIPQNVSFNMQQPRHQSHGAGTPNPGPAPNLATFQQSFFVHNAQQPIQSYPYAPAPLFQMPMRNQQAVPNSAQFPQQAQQPQQAQVAQQILSNPAGQSMVTMMPPNAPSGMPVQHSMQQQQQYKPRKRPEKALKIIDPVTGEDISAGFWAKNEHAEERLSASNTPQPSQEESIEKATVAAEFASKVAVAVSSDGPLVESEGVANGPTSRSVSPPPPEPPQPKPPAEQIPTVSAKTNSPTVELHRHQPAAKPSPLVQQHYLPQPVHIPLSNPQPISQPYSPPSPSPSPPPQPATQPPPQRPPTPPTKVETPRTQSTSPTRKNQQVAQVQNEKAKPKKDEKPAKKEVAKVPSASPTPPVVTATAPPLPSDPSPKSEPAERQPSPPPQPTLEDTNGETDDAVKAQQRPKANKQKKKDLNRKGVEKEGTDMDAFQVVDEPVETPEDPPEVEKDVADAIVAAKNEENNKVSANNNNNNESVEETQVIESMTIERSEPQLQYHYKESQWSPINTEGKKVYDRDFLMEVKNNPLSIKRPENLANDSLFKETPNVIPTGRRLNSSSNSMGGIPRNDNSMNFVRSSSSQRGSSMKNMGMRGGSRTMGGGHGSMHNKMMKTGSSGNYNMLGMYRDEPNLHKVANSWKPSRLINNTSLSEEELKTEGILKAMRGILNKLTPQKFERLLEKVNKLDINNEERMKKVVDLVFEKAIDEPSFSTMYAQLCYSLQLMKVQVVKEKVEEGKEGAPPQTQQLNFRKVLLQKCQADFEKSKEDEMDIDARQKQIAETKDQDKKKELMLAFEEDERKIRIKSVGLVRFIGELYKKGMLTHNIMHICINSLIEKTDEESLECLCKLLTTIGKDLESKSSSNEFTTYFATMTKLSHKSPDSKISSRIRFMLQDVIDLRANKWVPRRDENKPKTIEQIQKDAERETMLESFQSMSNMNRGNRNDDRRRPQKSQASEDGWHNVNKTRSSNYTLESQKLINMKSSSEPDNLLGKPGQFTQWSMGAKRQNTDNKSFTSANKFDLLQTQEDRKLPLYGGNRKGVTPSPSIEKERAIAGVKALRGSGSGPNSRESSRSRYGSSPATSISKEEKPEVKEELTEEQDEQLSRSTRLVIDEYFSNKSATEAYESIQEVFVGPRLKIFIEKSLSHVTENTNPEKRSLFANLLVILIKEKKLLPKKDVIVGFSQIMENEDLITDLPLMWRYLAQLIAPLIAQEAFDFLDLKLASKQIAKENVSKLLAEIITLLIKEKGPSWIRTQWESCRMNIKDFVPENENLDKFITDKKLGFLTGSADFPHQPDESLTSEEIEEKLLKFLKNDTNKAIDHTCEWIQANVSDKALGVTLVKAVTRACIKGSIVKEKVDKVFERNMCLIKKYVDNDEKYELASLYAAQHLLANEIVPPPTTIQEIFEALYSSGTISYEGFMKWKETKSSEEYEAGKGVLLSVLSSFFVMLSENSNDTEEES